MLNRRRDDMLSLALVCQRSADQRQIVRLRAARRKDDLLLIAAERLRDLLFCFFNLILRRLSHVVQGGRIAVIFR